MRIIVAAVGRLKQGPETELSERYRKRTVQTGRQLGLRDVEANDRSAIVFLIGGPDGLAAGLREKAELHLSFGTATWPHQMVRVMLLEQLYRVATILTGHPYHRA